MTTINIALTNAINLVGVEIDKPFNEITYTDIKEIVNTRLGNTDGVSIQGWCNVTKKETPIFWIASEEAALVKDLSDHFFNPFT